MLPCTVPHAGFNAATVYLVNQDPHLCLAPFAFWVCGTKNTQSMQVQAVVPEHNSSVVDVCLEQLLLAVVALNTYIC